MAAISGKSLLVRWTLVPYKPADGLLSVSLAKETIDVTADVTAASGFDSTTLGNDRGPVHTIVGSGETVEDVEMSDMAESVDEAADRLDEAAERDEEAEERVGGEGEALATADGAAVVAIVAVAVVTLGRTAEVVAVKGDVVVVVVVLATIGERLPSMLILLDEKLLSSPLMQVLVLLRILDLLVRLLRESLEERKGDWLLPEEFILETLSYSVF